MKQEIACLFGATVILFDYAQPPIAFLLCLHIDRRIFVLDSSSHVFYCEARQKYKSNVIHEQPQQIDHTSQEIFLQRGEQLTLETRQTNGGPVQGLSHLKVHMCK
jgi:hypothetical protein